MGVSGAIAGPLPPLLSPRSSAGVVWLSARGDGHQDSRHKSIPGVVVLGLHVPDANAALVLAIPDRLRRSLGMDLETTNGGRDFFAVLVVDKSRRAIHRWHGAAFAHSMVIRDGSGDLLNPDAGFADTGNDVPVVKGHGVTPRTGQDLTRCELLKFLDGLEGSSSVHAS